MRTPLAVDRRLALIRCGDETRRLRPGSSLSLGRHQQNKLILAGASVSRFHATIRWDSRADRPVILDHGSQNGTLVDGARVVGTAPLSGGSTVRIANWTVTVELQPCGQDDAAILNGTDDRVALFTEVGPAMNGTVTSGAGLIEVIQRLEAQRRTGTLYIKGDGVHGEVTLCLGKIMAVELGDAHRTRALEQLLLLRGQATYVLAPDFEPAEEALDLWFSSYLRAQAGGRPTRRLTGM